MERKYWINYLNKSHLVKIKNVENEFCYTLLDNAVKKLVTNLNISDFDLLNENNSPIDREKTLSEIPSFSKFKLVKIETAIEMDQQFQNLTVITTDRNVDIERVLGNLKSISGAQLNSSRINNSRKTFIQPTTNNNQVFFGFNIVTPTDLLVHEIWNSIKVLNLELPKMEDDENTIIHKFINNVLGKIAICSPNKNKMKKIFYEYDAHFDGERPVWIFTASNEQIFCSNNICFYMEAKRVSTTRKSNSRAGQIYKSTEVLIREGLAQLIQRITHRYEDSGRTTTHGIGVVLNGLEIQIVKISFQDNEQQTIFPIFLSTREKFIDNSEHAPLGFRWLLTLLFEDNLETFGLTFNAPKLNDLTYDYLLGEGGFGIVSKYVNNSNQNEIAVKYLRHASKYEDTNFIANEILILQELTSKQINNVPLFISNFETPFVGFVFQPVGIQLEKYVNDKDINIISYLIIEKIFKVLHSVHLIDIVHGDIRPNNIIFYNDEPYLIDWGLSASLKNNKSFQRKYLFGVIDFMADEKINLLKISSNTLWKPTKNHDIEALIYTYSAIKFNPQCNPPWCIWNSGIDECNKYIETRKGWIKSNIDKHTLPNDLQPIYDSIVLNIV